MQHNFLSFADFFQNVLKKYFAGIPSVSNSFETDKARCFVVPDLDPICLQAENLAGKEL